MTSQLPSLRPLIASSHSHAPHNTKMIGHHVVINHPAQTWKRAPSFSSLVRNVVHLLWTLFPPHALLLLSRENMFSSEDTAVEEGTMKMSFHPRPLLVIHHLGPQSIPTHKCVCVFGAPCGARSAVWFVLTGYDGRRRMMTRSLRGQQQRISRF